MDTGYWRLENKVPKRVDTVIEWGEWFESIGNRIVKRTTIRDVEVSTVFLGLDYRFGPGEPLLFGTMIFGGEHNGYLNRYSTWEEAEEGHQEACEMVVNS